ncbi:MAG: hypothetical protein IKO35_00715 [Elusimicrobiaceae bacterium]|nr:hypothetical protein [Elusimicrobiaceae bacterium]
MKKNLYICLLGLLALLSAPSSWAQGSKIGKLLVDEIISFSEKTGVDVMKAIDLEEQLTLRAWKVSKKNVADVNEKFKKGLGPNAKTFNALEHSGNIKIGESLMLDNGLHGRDLYPRAPKELIDPTGYAIAKEELEIRKRLLTDEARMQKIRNLLEKPGFLERISWSELVPPGEEINFLVSQITPQTQYLIIGEEMSNPKTGDSLESVEDAAIDLVEQINLKLGKHREIFVFSGFLPVGFFQIPGQGIIPEFEDEHMAELCAANEIPIIGLERFNTEGTFWQTIEGLRLRNQKWLETIRNYRDFYPDALFIIHAPQHHVSYDEPYSLGKLLSKENVLVTEIGSDVSRLANDLTVTEKKAFALPSTERKRLQDDAIIDMDPYPVLDYETVRVLRIKDPAASRLFGFDARITVKP